MARQHDYNILSAVAGWDKSVTFAIAMPIHKLVQNCSPHPPSYAVKSDKANQT